MVPKSKKGRPLLAETLSPYSEELTLDQKLLVKEVIESNGDIARSVAKVYGVNKGKLSLPKYRTEVGAQILNRPLVRSYIEKILEDAGLTDGNIAEALKLITEAGISESSLDKATPSDALKALRISLELKDRFPSKKIEARNINVETKLTILTVEQLKEELVKVQSETQRFLEALD